MDLNQQFQILYNSAITITVQSLFIHVIEKRISFVVSFLEVIIWFKDPTQVIEFSVG